MRAKVFDVLHNVFPDTLVDFIESNEIVDVIPIYTKDTNLDKVIVLFHSLTKSEDVTTTMSEEAHKRDLYEFTIEALKRDLYELTIEVGRLKQENKDLEGALGNLRKINEQQDRQLEVIQSTFNTFSSKKSDEGDEIELFLEDFDGGTKYA